MRTWKTGLSIIVASATAAPADACTLCHSRTADAVRDAVFAAAFWDHLAAVFLPVPVLAGAVLLVCRLVR